MCAICLKKLEIKGHNRKLSILDIGCGTGHLTALIAFLVSNVYIFLNKSNKLKISVWECRRLGYINKNY